jgi:hypothetical protein
MCIYGHTGWNVGEHHQAWSTAVDEMLVACLPSNQAMQYVTKRSDNSVIMHFRTHVVINVFSCLYMRSPFLKFCRSSFDTPVIDMRTMHNKYSCFEWHCCHIFSVQWKPEAEKTPDKVLWHILIKWLRNTTLETRFANWEKPYRRNNRKNKYSLTEHQSENGGCQLTGRWCYSITFPLCTRTVIPAVDRACKFDVHALCWMTSQLLEPCILNFKAKLTPVYKLH